MLAARLDRVGLLGTVKNGGMLLSVATEVNLNMRESVQAADCVATLAMTKPDSDRQIASSPCGLLAMTQPPSLRAKRSNPAE